MGLYAIDCSECKKPFMWFSGRGPDQRCAECCGIMEEGDIVHDLEPQDFDAFMQRVEDDRKQRQQQAMDEHMVKTSSAKKL